MAAPDFDTYHCLERFARHPDRVNAMGVEALLHRVDLRLTYEVGSEYKHADAELVEKVFNIRIGLPTDTKTTEATRVSGKDVHDMTDAERMALYVKVCQSAGLNITEDMLSNKQTQ